MVISYQCEFSLTSLCQDSLFFFFVFFLLRDTSFAFRFAQCELASWLEWKHSYYGADEAF